MYHLVGAVDDGGCCARVGQQVYGKPLSRLLNFAVTLRLLFKKMKSIKKTKTRHYS